MSLRELHAHLVHHAPKHNVKVGRRAMIGWSYGNEVYVIAKTFLALKTGRTGRSVSFLTILACQDLIDRGIFVPQGQGSRYVLPNKANKRRLTSI